MAETGVFWSDTTSSVFVRVVNISGVPKAMDILDDVDG